MVLRVLNEKVLAGNPVMDNIEDNVLIPGVEMLVSNTSKVPSLKAEAIKL